MNLFQRATRSCFRKPVKSLLLLLVVCIISLLFLSGMASRSANIATKDSTRQAIGAGFLLEYNPENRSQRVDEACQKISELYPDGQGSYGGVHQIKYTVMGSENWGVLTDNSFESLKQDDIEKIAGVEGIADYNITTVPTAVKHKNFERIEDADTDQTNDFQGVTLIGNRDMMLDANVLSGNVSVIQGRMTTKDDLNACVISEELANRNQLKVGDRLQFHAVKNEEPVQEATIVGIYQVKERMKPYMSGDTFRSENVIFTDLHFPEKVEQDDPLYEKAYFKVENVDDYDAVKEAIKKTNINGKVVYSLDFEVTPHQLRHTYITNLIHASVDPKTVQYLAGHESSKITMDIYAKVKYNRPDELVRSMSCAFASWDTAQ